MYSSTDGDSQEQLIEALISDQKELLGWNHVLREGVTRSLVSAQSDQSSVLITVPGNENYRIIDPCVNASRHLCCIVFTASQLPMHIAH